MANEHRDALKKTLPATSTALALAGAVLVGAATLSQAQQQPQPRATSPAATPLATITLRPVGGVYGIFERALPERTGRVEAVPLEVEIKGADGRTHPLRVSLSVRDLWGGLRLWNRALTFAPGVTRQSVALDLGMGFFEVSARVQNEGNAAATNAAAANATATTEIAVVPPHRAGVRAHSFFASNTS